MIKTAKSAYVIFAFIIFFPLTSTNAASAVVADADWTGMNNGLFNGTVLGTAWCGGSLYFYGIFTHIRGLETGGIVKWDGTGWKSLGRGTKDSVKTVAFDNAGNVYIGGAFDSVDGIAASHIAKWDGHSWSALGQGVSGNIVKICFDKIGNLYAAGNFSRAGSDTGARNVAVWNGSAWSRIGAYGSNFFGPYWVVTSLAVDSSNNVYVGGYVYSSTCSVCTSAFAEKWDGTFWSETYFAWGVQSFRIYCVGDIEIDHAGTIYLAGANLCRRMPNDSNWNQVIDTGWSHGCIAFDDSNNLYARVGTSLKKWNGSVWSFLPAPEPYSLTIDPAGNIYETELVYPDPGLISVWNGTKWKAFYYSYGISHPATVLAADGTGNLYLGMQGNTSQECFPYINGAGVWNNTGWSTLGAGIPYPGVEVDVPGRWSSSNGYFTSVYTLVRDRSGNLFAGGIFDTVDVGTSSNGIAKWNGSTWSTLGTGLSRWGVAIELAFDAGGNLWAGGYFDSVNGIPAKNIAKWNGSAWATLGTGINHFVEALAFDKSGNLYAAGNFDTAGGVPVRNIARWNGSTWYPLGTGINNPVTVIAFDTADGTLYAGGSFDTAGGIPARNIAKWNGTAWSALGSGTDDPVLALRFDNHGNLYAGGLFGTAGGITCNCVAKWNGSAWSSLGSGLSNNYWASRPVCAMALEIVDSTLFVGGNFTNAGDKYSPYIAEVNINGSKNGAINPFGRPQGGSVAAVHYRLINSTIVFSNLAPHDRVFLFSLSGRCIREAQGVSRIKLSNIGPQPLIVRVNREGKIVSTGMVMAQ